MFFAKRDTKGFNFKDHVVMDVSQAEIKSIFISAFISSWFTTIKKYNKNLFTQINGPIKQTSSRTRPKKI